MNPDAPLPPPPVLTSSLDDLFIPGVIVEVDPDVADEHGAFLEYAVSEADAWDANGDLPSEGEGNEYVSRVAAGIIKQLREGTAPWIRTWRPGERYLPHNPISGQQFRASNVVLLMVQSQERGYVDTRWMTSRQAESMGGQVRRGEERKGTTIQFWKWEGTRTLPDGSGASRVDRRMQYTRPRVFATTVFNAEQIDGLAEPAYIARQPSETERYERADRILTASGVPIQNGAETLHAF